MADKDMIKKVKVLKSQKNSDTYIFLDKNKCFSELPEGLQKSFGSHETVLEIELSPSKKLARAHAEDVLAAIESKGFYLQLPPSLKEIKHGRS